MTKPTPKIMWSPTDQKIAQSKMTQFAKQVENSEKLTFNNYQQLHEWSTRNSEKFWSMLWDYTEIIGEKGHKILDNADQMEDAQWFPDSKLNFAQNLLRFRDSENALVFWGEEKARAALSYQQLYDEVSKLRQALQSFGIAKGDRVAAYLPNMPETIIAMLAATSLGAIWSSCSPDFGAQGVLDRFGQIKPKVLFTTDGYWFKEKPLSITNKVEEIIKKIPELKHTIVVPYITDGKEVSLPGETHIMGEILEDFTPSEIEFEMFDFNHPLYIMFSSGTTGKPKCIVHGAGGTLLEHKKELELHTNVSREDNLFYQTTCGWMMWNWLVSGLSSGTTLLLYDGFPFLRDGNILLDFAQEQEMTIFGTNAKYISLLEKMGLKPRETHNLSKLHTMTSTGSPLIPENYDYIHRDFHEDICLASISGGTDIIGCFTLGCPTLPVYRGETQCVSLGYNVQVYNESGSPVVGEKGELVCTAPFPSQPVSFWNDDDGKRYHDAYFDHFENIWRHGDWAELTERGTMIISGRSDAVLNPGGVRIGTAEIYRQVETIPEIVEAIVVGQKWKDDTRVVLFVRLEAEKELSEETKELIRQRIKKGASPFHVPKKIIQVNDIPRTRSGKITEIAVRKTIHGEAVTNTEALANPETLDHFKELPDLLTE